MAEREQRSDSAARRVGGKSTNERAMDTDADDTTAWRGPCRGRYLAHADPSQPPTAEPPVGARSPWRPTSG